MSEELRQAAMDVSKALVELTEWLPEQKRTARDLRKRAMKARVDLLAAIANDPPRGAVVQERPVLAYLVETKPEKGGGQYLRFNSPPEYATDNYVSVIPLVSGEPEEKE